MEGSKEEQNRKQSTRNRKQRNIEGNADDINREEENEEISTLNRTYDIIDLDDEEIMEMEQNENKDNGMQIEENRINLNKTEILERKNYTGNDKQVEENQADLNKVEILERKNYTGNDKQENIWNTTNTNNTMDYDEIIKVIEHIEEEYNKKIKENLEHGKIKEATNEEKIKEKYEEMRKDDEMKCRNSIPEVEPKKITKRKYTDLKLTSTKAEMKRNGGNREIGIKEWKPTEDIRNVEQWGYNTRQKDNAEQERREADTDPVANMNPVNDANTVIKGINTYNEKRKKLVLCEIKGGFEDHTKNTELKIPEEVKIILSLGEKFIIPYKSYEMEDIIAMINDTEEVWDITPIGGKTKNFSEWKNRIIKEMTRTNRRYSKNHREIINLIMELEEFMKRNRDLYIAKSDKGKKTILIKKTEFEQMKRIFMEKAVNSNLYKWEGKMTREQIEIINTRELEKLRRKMKIWKIKGIFKEKTEQYIQIEVRLWEIANNIEGKIPKMEFLVKTHKPEGLKLRNICPKNNACTYQISVILTHILEDTLEESWRKMKYYDTNIYNSINFAEQLQTKSLKEDEKITIYDIKEMFNNIDTDKLINIIERHMDYKKYNRDTIMEMIRYDIKEANWVTTDGNIYKQNRGIPMGSPTSTIYAKIYTDYFFMINKEELEKNGVREIHKFIDDIMIIHKKGCERKIKDIMEQELKLEMKIENEDENQEVEFLDIKIYIRQNGVVKTKWNKKKYVSNRTIHSKSQIDKKTKEATLLNRIIRTTKITSEEFVYDCIQTNIEEFLNNGYNTMEIREILRKAILKIKNTENQYTKNKIAQLEECIKTLYIKIKQEQVARKLRKVNKENWKRMHGKTKCRKINKKTKLKGILPRSKACKKKLKGTKYIRVPYNIDKININRNIRNIFTDKIHTVNTTRRDKKLDTIIKNIQGSKNKEKIKKDEDNKK